MIDFQQTLWVKTLYINLGSLHYLASAEDLSKEPEEDESFVYGILGSQRVLTFYEKNLVKQTVNSKRFFAKI